MAAAPAHALPDDGAANNDVAPAATCGSTQFCTWSQRDFHGTKYSIPDYGNGVCMTGGGYAARSYINNSRIEGYFYANSGCSGQARAVRRGSSRDIGFTAHSFRFACVSC